MNAQHLSSRDHGRSGSRGPRPTLKDVAGLAKVSIKTVSRVINDDPHVAPQTRGEVTRAIEMLGYVPDPAARSLRAGTDRTVGVVVDSNGDIFFAELVAKVEEILDEAGYHALIASSNRDRARERETVLSLVQRRTAGLIVAPTSEVSLDGLPIRDTPVVFVDRVGSMPGAQSVVADDRGLARLATEHLIRHGHRRIAVISDVEAVATTRERHLGYRDALAAAGIALDESLVRPDCPDAPAVIGALGALLEAAEPPTAILSTSSRLSLGIVPVLHQHGRTDIALVSYGDFAMADSLSPAVTVIDHSASAMGEAAARSLVARLLGPPEQDPLPSVIQVPARLIPRGSGELAPWTHHGRDGPPPPHDAAPRDKKEEE